MERLSVLIVDDSAISRTIIRRVLEILGIRLIFSAEDGFQAADFLRLVEADPLKAGASQIDLVITDLIMPRCDGPSLIRWIRRSPASPDRYTPIIAISGAPARERVQLARDLGAHEVLGKPFTAEALGSKIVNIVNHPRPFVLAPDYFGPDRRGSQQVVSKETREAERKIPTIWAEDRKAMPQSSGVLFIRQRNRLQDKLGGGAAVPPFDPLQVMQAEQSIRGLASSYGDWIEDAISKLRTFVSDLNFTSEAAAEQLARIRSLALELGSQGGMFDYPLVTTFGYSLYATTNDPNFEAIDDNYMALLEAHVDGLETVVRYQITGDGGAIGREILEALEKARMKYRRMEAVAS